MRNHQARRHSLKPGSHLQLGKAQQRVDALADAAHHGQVVRLASIGCIRDSLLHISPSEISPRRLGSTLKTERQPGMEKETGCTLSCMSSTA